MFAFDPKQTLGGFTRWRPASWRRCFRPLRKLATLGILAPPKGLLEPLGLGKFVAKHCRVRTICLPNWIVGIAPQVRRTQFWKNAVETTALQVIEYFAIFDRVEIKTKHRQSTIEKIKPSIIRSIADFHQILLRSLAPSASEGYDSRINMDQTSVVIAHPTSGATAHQRGNRIAA
jgi:hypothetical protein